MTGFLALFLLAILFLACMAGLAYLVSTAPEGHEIEGVGFRYGPPPDLSDAEGHELHTIYHAGGDLPDGDRDAAPLSPFHSQGVPQ